MESKKLFPTTSLLKGDVHVPGDKSISHRAIIFGSLSHGKTKITNFLDGEDCMRSIHAFEAMGVSIEKKAQEVTIEGTGAEGLHEPTTPINLGNSGTTARLLIGVLAGLPFHVTLFGDDSLTKRPMDRVTVPLRKMGARIDGRENGKYLPLAMRGGDLNAISFESPVKSAQVKSAILLAGLLAKGATQVTEKTTTRDHTENMLQAFGGSIVVEKEKMIVEGEQKLTGTTIQVPGDISSAAFFLVAAAIVPGSEVTLKDVGLNHTRTGIIDVLQLMGVDIDVVEERHIGGESIGSITVRSSNVKGIEIGGDVIPRMIDEIPIVALLATQASGTTIIKDAEELRFKESDRIASVVNTLKALGASITATDDGMIIEGQTKLTGARVNSLGDHRIGMMIAIASLITSDQVTLEDPDCINISYPTFFEHLKQIQKN